MSASLNRFCYRHSFIETDAGYDAWGAMAVADFDCDGRPEFVTGGKGGGFLFLYDLDPVSGIWRRHAVSEAYSPNVGAAAHDWDRDGRPEIVTGEWGTRLWWFSCPTGDLDAWEGTVVYDGLSNPHDLLACDIDGDGTYEVIVRNKGGDLLVLRPGTDPRVAWQSTIVASGLEGDGTAVARVTAGGGTDLVTNCGWFENVRGDGSRWEHHPFVPDGLQFDPESRVQVADLDGNGMPVAVVTESEIPDGRMVLLRYRDSQRPWESELLIDADERVCGMHSLQVADLDGDGKLEIFTAEMENRRTDGVLSKPRWIVLARARTWEKHIILDQNLGSHSAVVADFDGDGQLEIVGKPWRANEINGADGKHHVDYLDPP